MNGSGALITFQIRSHLSTYPRASEEARAEEIREENPNISDGMVDKDNHTEKVGHTAEGNLSRCMTDSHFEA